MSPANVVLLFAWALLTWRGGLMDWQAPAGAALGLAALWLGRPRGGDSWRLGRMELALGAWILAYAGLGLAGARPQDGLNEGLLLAALLALAVQARRRGPDPGTVAVVWMAMASAAIVVFFAAGWLVPPRWPEDSVGPLLRPHLSSRWVAPNQNLLGASLALPAVLLGLAGLAQGWAGWRRWLAALSLALAAAACVYAGSRGVWLALAVSLAWLCLRWRGPGRGRLWLLAGLTVLALGAGALWAPFSTSRLRVQLQSDVKEADPNNGRRLDFWRGSLWLSRERPWTGWGAGSFPLEALRIDLPTPLDEKHPIARYRLGLDHAHNDWLELAVEAGWPLALAAAALAGAWLFRRWRREGLGPAELGLEAALVGALAFSLNDMNLRTPGLLFGLALVGAVLEPAGEAGGWRWPPWLGPCLGSLLLWVLMGWWQAQALHRATAHRDASPAWRWTWVRWSQPLDGEAAAWRLRQAQPGWPWDAWAGRDEPEWWWASSDQGGATKDAVGGLDATRRALDLRPYDAPGWFIYGLRLQSVGAKTEAELVVRHSLQLEPNFCRALAWSCDAALARHDKSLALRDYQALLKASQLKMRDDTLDDYSRTLQSVDPAWLRDHQRRFGVQPSGT